MFTKRLIFHIFFSITQYSVTHAFGSGAPTDSCTALKPNHAGSPPQSSPFPFKLILDKNSVSPGEKLQLTIVPTNGKIFKGFLAQARKIGGGSTPQGKFERGPNSQLLNCRGEGGAITHSDSIVKESVTLTWAAPRGNSANGKYQILVTVVVDFTTFWISQPSDVIEVK